MTIADWLLITVTLLSPFLAVQAQKWIEEFRDYRQQKIKIFYALMQTRAHRLSFEHVQALNTIELAFRRSSKSEKTVREKWSSYLGQMEVAPREEDRDKFTDAQLNAVWSTWEQKRQDLFVELLRAIGDDVGHIFSGQSILRGIYSPVAHGKLEQDQEIIRKGLASLLSGNHPIKMSISDFPVNEAAMAQHIALSKALEKLLSDAERIAITVPTSGEKAV